MNTDQDNKNLAQAESDDNLLPEQNPALVSNGEVIIQEEQKKKKPRRCLFTLILIVLLILFLIWLWSQFREKYNLRPLDEAKVTSTPTPTATPDPVLVEYIMETSKSKFTYDNTSWRISNKTPVKAQIDFILEREKDQETPVSQIGFSALRHENKLNESEMFREVNISLESERAKGRGATLLKEISKEKIGDLVFYTYEFSYRSLRHSAVRKYYYIFNPASNHIIEIYTDTYDKTSNGAKSIDSIIKSFRLIN